MSPQPVVHIKELGVTAGHSGQRSTVASEYQLDNGSGVTAAIWDYGGHLVSVRTPDMNGVVADVVLCRGGLADYDQPDRAGYVGATIGRYANRIANGAFELDGVTHQLATNDGPNHLHGGAAGFDQYVWQAETFAYDECCGVTLRHQSPAGDEGYPGSLEVTLTYTLGAGPALAFDYEATTDAPTIVNLTNHAYWNLDGRRGTGSVANQYLEINASDYLPVDAGFIPLETARSVDGTVFDFRKRRLIGQAYDHCFVLDSFDPDGSTGHAARMTDPVTGRTMSVETDQPGLQVYTAHHLTDDGDVPALCLEAQRFPDSPNRQNWPSAILRPGEVYRQRTVHRFGLL